MPQVVLIPVTGVAEQRDVPAECQRTAITAALGGAFTIVGSYPRKGIVVARLANATRLPMNDYILPPPMDHEIVHGPILMLAVDYHGNMVDLTLADFQEVDSPAEDATDDSSDVDSMELALR